MMKKLLAVLLAAAFAGSALTGCGGNGSASQSASSTGGAASASSASSDPSVTLKIGFSTNEEDPRAKAASQFKDEVEKKTNGAVKVELYPSGQLGGDAALIEALATDSGTADIIITDASNFSTYEAKMGISALPFQFSDFDQAWAFMDSDIEKEAEDLLNSHNMKVLAHYDNGFRCVTTSKHPVNSPADMKNMLIRTPENPVIMATMKALGANPQPLAFSELYTALQQGTYDAQENPIPVIYNNNLFEVQKYLAVTNHIYSGMCFAISLSTWNKMSRNEQDIVSAAAKSSQDYDRKLNKQQTEDLLSKLKDKGMQITQPDLTAFATATASVETNMKSTYGDLIDKLETWKSQHKAS